MRRFSHQKGPGPYLGLRQQVQAHFGFTLVELARVLGVSRAVLAMSDGVGRHLPPAATLRLHQLYAAIGAPEAAPATVAEATSATDLPPPAPLAAPALHPADATALHQRRQGLRIEAYKLGQQLARCQTRLAQAHLRQQVLPGLAAALPPAEERLRQWLAGRATPDPDEQRADASALAVLALRQRVLAFELAELDALLGPEAPGRRPN